MRLSCPPGCSGFMRRTKNCWLSKLPIISPFVPVIWIFLPEAAAPPFMEKVPVAPSENAIRMD